MSQLLRQKEGLTALTRKGTWHPRAHPMSSGSSTSTRQTRREGGSTAASGCGKIKGHSTERLPQTGSLVPPLWPNRPGFCKCQLSRGATGISAPSSHPPELQEFLHLPPTHQSPRVPSSHWHGGSWPAETGLFAVTNGLITLGAERPVGRFLTSRNADHVLGPLRVTSAAAGPLPIPAAGLACTQERFPELLESYTKGQHGSLSQRHLEE